MAASPAHRFGQLIGEIVEPALEPVLREFATRHGLFLDKQGPRAARKGRKKVRWIDIHGNRHDLDYVLERGGSDQKVGVPVAFIESAWRTYTKHSRNKVQEIQGAILPLVETHGRVAPFIGAMLAGVFTDGALRQLESLGFKLLYFSHAEIAEAFRVVGINTEWREDTPDVELAERVKACEALSQEQRERVGVALLAKKSDDVQVFLDALERSVTRQVTYVRVTPLHGVTRQWDSIEQAIEFVELYREVDAAQPFVRYEVELHYSNGDELRARFGDKATVLAHLRSFLPTAAVPAVE